MVKGKLRQLTTLECLRLRGGELAGWQADVLLEDGGEGDEELEGGEE